jgi:N-acetylglucosamine malate deacetylase 1
VETAKTFVRHILVLLARFTFRLRSQPYRMESRATLVIAPHPDDETLGCGALIARKRAAGHPVRVVFLTDGGASHRDEPDLSRAALTRIREEEAKAALAELGVDPSEIRFLGSPDGNLARLDSSERARLVSGIADAARDVAAREVFVPCSPDGSSEHDVVLDLARDAVRSPPPRPQIWEYPVWTWRQPRVLWEKVTGGQAVVRCSMDKFRKAKERALLQHRSQVEPRWHSHRPVLPREVRAACLADPEYFFAEPETRMHRDRPQT